MANVVRTIDKKKSYRVVLLDNGFYTIQQYKKNLGWCNKTAQWWYYNDQDSIDTLNRLF